jgi:hypothetical protein
MDRRRRVVASWGTVFVAALAAGHSVYAAAELAGIDRTTANKWRHRDPDFARAWAAAVDQARRHRDAAALEQAGAASLADYSDHALAIMAGKRAKADT